MGRAKERRRVLIEGATQAKLSVPSCACGLCHKAMQLTMDTGRPRSATALFALIGALSPQPMHAFAARMGSSALLPTFVKGAPSSLMRRPSRYGRIPAVLHVRSCCRYTAMNLVGLFSAYRSRGSSLVPKSVSAGRTVLV